MFTHSFKNEYSGRNLQKVFAWHPIYENATV